MGELLDLSRGGVRLTLEHGLARDEYVKLFFPSKSEKTRPEGRMIIGHVVQSKREADRHIVRIAFGWDAAMADTSRPIRKDAKSTTFFRPWSAKLMAVLRSGTESEQPRTGLALQSSGITLREEDLRTEMARIATPAKQYAGRMSDGLTRGSSRRSSALGLKSRQGNLLVEYKLREDEPARGGLKRHHERKVALAG